MNIYKDKRLLILLLVNTLISILLFIGFRFTWGPDGTHYFLATHKLFEPQLYGNMSSYIKPLYLLFTKFFIEFTPDNYFYIKLTQHFLGFLCPFIVYYALKSISLNFALCVALMLTLDLNTRYYFTVYCPEPLFILFLSLLLYGASRFITSSNIFTTLYFFVPTILCLLTRVIATYLPFIAILFSLVLRRRKEAILLFVVTIFLYIGIGIYERHFQFLKTSGSAIFFNFYIYRNLVKETNGEYTKQLGLKINEKFYESKPTDKEMENFWKDLETNFTGIGFARDMFYAVIFNQPKIDKEIEGLLKKSGIEAFKKYYFKTLKELITFHPIEFHRFRPKLSYDFDYFPAKGTKDKLEIRKIQQKRHHIKIPDWLVTPIKEEFYYYAQWSPVLIWPFQKEEEFFYYDSGSLKIMIMFDYLNCIIISFINVLIYIISPTLLFILIRKFSKYPNLFAIIFFSILTVFYFNVATVHLYVHPRYRDPLGIFYFVIAFGLIKIFINEYNIKFFKKETLLGILIFIAVFGLLFLYRSYKWLNIL